MEIIHSLSQMIQCAKVLGLPVKDVKNAQEFLEHHEFSLCFDTIVTQMYEYDIEINNQFYSMVSEIANKINISIEDYAFIKELIRSESTIPKPVKDLLAQIIASLDN